MAQRFTQLLGAFAVCAMVLVGCGDAGPASEAESSTETTGSATPSTPVESESSVSATESSAPTTESAPPAAESSPAGTDATEVKSATSVTPTPDPEPVIQAETCDWDNARLASGSAPGRPDGPGATDVASVLIGAWQHTHIDSGAGFEALEPTTDIRYVFPTTERLLYCQDVKGATSQAENAADITLSGTDIVLPGGAPGYTIVAWDADTMVWMNNRDGTLYLLERR